MRISFLICLTLLLLPGSAYSYPVHNLGSLDSVRFERINGQWLFVHNIAQGETLYSLSRKFHLDIRDIEKVNDISLKPLSVDQNIYVPI